MKIRMAIVTAALSTAALAITSGTATADPVVPDTISGTTDGVGYTITRTDVDTITTTLAGGTFRRTPEGIDVLTADGRTIAHLPLVIAVDERHDAEITPTVDGSTLIADVSAKEIGTWRMTSPWERSIGAGIGIGVLTGALVGGFLGMVIGILTGGLLIPMDAQLHTRLAMAGADRPDAVTLADRVCAILRDTPTPTGKAAARAYLRASGVQEGFQDGWILGTAVDVYCPEMIGALR